MIVCTQLRDAEESLVLKDSVVASASADIAKPAAEAAAATGKPAGYRVTPHVAKYYDKARI